MTTTHRRQLKAIDTLSIPVINRHHHHERKRNYRYQRHQQCQQYEHYWVIYCGKRPSASDQRRKVSFARGHCVWQHLSNSEGGCRWGISHHRNCEGVFLFQSFRHVYLCDIIRNSRPTRKIGPLFLRVSLKKLRGLFKIPVNTARVRLRWLCNPISRIWKGVCGFNSGIVYAVWIEVMPLAFWTIWKKMWWRSNNRTHGRDLPILRKIKNILLVCRLN